MNMLVLGSGGRESAYIIALLTDPEVKNIYVIGFHAGFVDESRVINCTLKDIHTLDVDLVVSGPEAFAADGTHDEFRKKGIPVFGASKRAARIETDKAWARKFMKKIDLPQPYFEIHTDPTRAKKAIKKDERLRVVKAAGLCGGKGVVVADTEKEAEQATDDILVKKIFGTEGEKIVLEERLGWHDPVAHEVSAMFVTDGKKIFALPLVQDYKREGDRDKGKNTGGMGCKSADDTLSATERSWVEKKIAFPLLQELKVAKTSFIGILYISLMKTR